MDILKVSSKSNPVSVLPKPKVQKNLPVFFRNEAMKEYFKLTEADVDEKKLAAFIACPEGKSAKKDYVNRLDRLIISMLYGLGLRRAELVSLDISSVDFGRKVVKVCGKGDFTPL